MSWRNWRLAAVLLGGAVLAVVLQVTVPRSRLYASVSPGLFTAIVALLIVVIVAAVTAFRRDGASADDRAARAAAVAAAAAASERQRFLLRLDHELKNPLTAIRAGLANLNQAQVTAATSAPTLVSISAQTDRIARLVSDLRKLTDLETQEIESAQVDLPSLLHEVVEAAAELPAASERVIRLTVPRAPWPLPLIEGDRDLLFIAFENLVVNAVKFSAPGDTIEVRATEDDGGLLLEVADTGTGIPEDEIGQVWEELARGRAARSLPGTGIGLALVRVIANRHGGQVAIRSRYGQGTVVSIRLPGPARARIVAAVAGPRHRRKLDA